MLSLGSGGAIGEHTLASGLMGGGVFGAPLQSL